MQIELSRTMRTTETITLPAYLMHNAGNDFYAIYAADNMVNICVWPTANAVHFKKSVVPSDFTTDGLVRITEEQWQQAVQEFQAIINNALNTQL